MKRARAVLAAFFLALSPAAIKQVHQFTLNSESRDPIPAAARAQVMEIYGQLPLAFEENRGQTDPQVKFISRGNGYALFLAAGEAVLALRAPDAQEPGDSRIAKRSVVRMRLVGANRKPDVAGETKLPGTTHYFIGNHSEKWPTDIASYARVRHKEVYPGIDLIYYGNQRQLEYDFVVAPDADPDAIRVRFDGVDGLRLRDDGSLLLDVSAGEIVQKPPVIYQEIDGTRQAVQGEYVLKSETEVGFNLGSYDRTQPLVIDPVMVYSTYLGGAGTERDDVNTGSDVSPDEAFGIAVDTAGNTYVTGATQSLNFPTAAPFQAAHGRLGTLVGSDAFVTKLNAAGTGLVYSTFLGGSLTDGGSAIAVDGDGNAYVTGRTYSTDFPTVRPIQAAKQGTASAFVAKLSASGSALMYSTYLGGATVLQRSNTHGLGIAVDAERNAYVTGFTGSTNFPTAGPIQAVFGGGNEDAFLTKLNAAGSALVYSTYLGGSRSDRGQGVAVDPAGNAYVTGQTSSVDFPTVLPLQASSITSNAFVTKVNAAGSALIYSTTLGGSSLDEGRAIAVDPLGNAYVTGTTASADFPVANALQRLPGGSGNHPYITKLNPAGTALIYSTYFGNGFGMGIAIDAAGSVYVTGTAGNIPIVSPLQAVVAGAGDAYVAKLNAAGSAVLFGTYLGGSGDDHGTAIAVDSAGRVYVTGITASLDYPTVNPYQRVHGGGTFDAFVAKLADLPTEQPPPPPNGGGCVDISGLWEWKETASLTYTLSASGVSETDSDTYSGSGTVTILQEPGSCSFSYDPVPSGSAAAFQPGRRTGTIVGDRLTFSGVFVVVAPGMTGVTLGANSVEGTGQVQGSTMTLSASGRFTGTLPGAGGVIVNVECIGNTAATFTRPSTPAPGTTFGFVDRGGVSLVSSGAGPATQAGYGSIQPASGNQTPSGLAIFGFRQGGVLVSEAGVPASSSLRSGRIYAEIEGPVSTGLAIANPNNQPATVSFFFTNAGGDFGSSTTTIPANGQIARFLHEAPFNGGSSLNGTFTFNSSVPVAVIALRGLTNERGEFLITTLPVIDLSAAATPGTAVFPHFADGGGWTTQIVLVNPTDAVLTGSIQFHDESGQMSNVTISGQTNNSFAYTIPARSSQKLRMSGASASILGGSARVIPAGNTEVPSGVAIFSLRNGATTVTEAGVPAVVASTAFRLYVEASGDFTQGASGSLQTGLAVSNLSATEATVTFELSKLDGSSTGLVGTLMVPANGQRAVFLSQIPGFGSLPLPFKGILRLSGSSAVSIVGLRGRYNERRDFLITTTPPVNEGSAASSTGLFFPHVADSGGYTTQFILFSGRAGQSSSGTMKFFTQAGGNWNLSPQ